MSAARTSWRLKRSSGLSTYHRVGSSSVQPGSRLREPLREQNIPARSLGSPRQVNHCAAAGSLMTTRPCARPGKRGECRELRERRPRLHERLPRETAAIWKLKALGVGQPFRTVWGDSERRSFGRLQGHQDRLECSSRTSSATPVNGSNAHSTMQATNSTQPNQGPPPTLLQLSRPPPNLQRHAARAPKPAARVQEMPFGSASASMSSTEA